MNNQVIEARGLIAKAREALRRGDRASAWQLGEQATHLAPNMEDVWLVLAASDPNPQEALAYARKALELNPQSARAHRAVEWTSGRLKQAEALKATSPTPRIVPNQAEAAASLPPKRAYQTAVAMPALRPQGRNWLIPALLVGTAFLVIGIIAIIVFASPMLGTLINSVSPAPGVRQENLWAPVDVAKPEAAPLDVSAFAPSNENNPSNEAPPLAEALQIDPTLSAVPALTDEPISTPTTIPTEEPTLQVVPAATETPGTMAMEIVEDTPTSEYVAPKPPVASSGNGARWIDVDLTNQRVYAYEGDVMVNSFIVSTGTWLTPTVTGTYKVYVKYRSASMSGPGYYLPDVPYIMYFYKGYGLHGTYWHNNFGTPMSHGCVNLRTDEAAWLFNWASVGTVVNVHY
jgi:lipoprotein-anchoring transpeptidase ErfK/SrfK